MALGLWEFCRGFWSVHLEFVATARMVWLDWSFDDSFEITERQKCVLPTRGLRATLAHAPTAARNLALSTLA